MDKNVQCRDPLNNPTVRSKMSTKSDDSAISSLADELEKRVMVEIERRATTTPTPNGAQSIPSIVSNLRSTSKSNYKNNESNYKNNTNDLFRNDRQKTPPMSINADSSGYSSISSTQSSSGDSNPVARRLLALAPGDSYHELDSRLKCADWYHKGLPKEVAISVLGQSSPGTFLVLPAILLLRGFDHVHEYQIMKKQNWMVCQGFKSCISSPVNVGCSLPITSRYPPNDFAFRAHSKLIKIF
jgi:hypothetical protein